ncbi:unnamed protein product [Mytilus coruscus]|uniref:Uncharacterized protein n=1 Tax=Mytilus coruscus TaxID=42192 RepID=A0A6J8D9Q1_MYTCO|nr:unnamed protein product [Mytilus coruscus]
MKGVNGMKKTALLKSVVEKPVETRNTPTVHKACNGDNLEAYVRGLESKGQAQEMYGALYMENLPPEIRKNIAREHGSDNISLIELRKSIVKEISILEVGQTTDYRVNSMTATCFAGAKSRQQSHYDHKQTKMPKETHVCVFCDGTHHSNDSNDCIKAKDPSTRVAVVKRKKLCFNCLGSLLAKECCSQNKCRKCSKKHTILCKGRFVAGQKSQSVKTEGQNGEKAVPVVMHTSSKVKLHSKKMDWDKPLPSELQHLWIKLAKYLKITTTAELRHYFTSSSVNMDHNELYVFVDASIGAYGAVAYIGNESNLAVVMAKNRVAPLKKLTLPQLDLMEALIGARLASHINTTLPSNKVVFWSDSQIVLHWLHTSRQLKRFVQKRIDEIKNLTVQDEWRYCPTKENPADLLTRGLTAEQFL